MLWKILSRMDRRRFDNTVISLTEEGPVGAEIRELGVPVFALDMRRGLPSPWAFVRLFICIRTLRPHIVQTWMYHADLVGGMAARLANGPIVVWNLRQSNLDAERSKWLTRFTAKLGAKLSRRLPDRVVCCSEQVARVHRAMGYAAEKMLVIQNGFDLRAYRPDPSARHALREELGISADQPVVGMVARFDPQKDHRNFIEAAAILVKHLADSRFILVGDGVTWQNQELLRWLDEFGVKERFFLLGRRADTPRLVNAFDIASLSSAFGEGFPNVIGEAMACEIPCVVTDVGDAGLLVDNTGLVVPPRQPGALAAAWLKLLNLDVEARHNLGRAARRRIKANFEIDKITTQYCGLYDELLSSKRTGKRATVV